MCIGGNQAFGITHTINFKTMTTINTDYSNTELLDQELNFDELQEVNGAVAPLVAGAWALGAYVAGLIIGKTVKG